MTDSDKVVDPQQIRYPDLFSLALWIGISVDVWLKFWHWQTFSLCVWISDHFFIFFTIAGKGIFAPLLAFLLVKCFVTDPTDIQICLVRHSELVDVWLKFWHW